MKWRILTLSVLGLSVLFSGVVFGADPIKLFVEIGGVTSTQGGPGAYLNSFYIWSIGIAAALAMLMIVVGGVQYTLSAGSIGSKDAAKKRITSALFGLLILLSITLILTTINPNLANINLEDPDAALNSAFDKTTADALLADILSFNYTDNDAESTAVANKLASLNDFFKTNRGGVSQGNVDQAIAHLVGEVESYFSAGAYLFLLKDDCKVNNPGWVFCTTGAYVDFVQNQKEHTGLIRVLPNIGGAVDVVLQDSLTEREAFFETLVTTALAQEFTPRLKTMLEKNRALIATQNPGFTPAEVDAFIQTELTNRTTALKNKLIAMNALSNYSASPPSFLWGWDAKVTVIAGEMGLVP